MMPTGLFTKSSTLIQSHFFHIPPEGGPAHSKKFCSVLFFSATLRKRSDNRFPTVDIDCGTDGFQRDIFSDTELLLFRETVHENHRSLYKHKSMFNSPLQFPHISWEIVFVEKPHYLCIYRSHFFIIFFIELSDKMVDQQRNVIFSVS